MLRKTLTILSLICVLWVCFVPSLYVVTLGEGIGEDWLVTSSSRIIGAWLIAHFLVLPIGLVLGLRWAWPRYPSSFGVIAGVVVALWCSTVLLAIPYLGIYPNLITAWPGVAISGGSNQGPAYFLPIILTNLLLWPLVASAWHRRWRRRQRVCLSCSNIFDSSTNLRCPKCGAPFDEQLLN